MPDRSVDPGASASRPALPPWLALAVAVVAISWAGPLVRFSDAPALAISAWRLVFAVSFIALVLAFRGRRSRWATLSRGEWGLAGASGLFLAGHFWIWIASVQLTTVASSVVLVSTHPFFVAAIGVAFLGERPSVREWSGMGVAFVGAVVIGWGDLALGGAALLGDLLAVSAALLVAAYYSIGRRLRAKLDLWSYVGIVYGVAAGALFLAMLVTPDVAVTGYSRTDWLVFLALAAGPMMLGHTGVNYALRWTPAYLASLPILGEPVGATLIAWSLPGIREVPPPGTFAGGALILAGIALALLRPAKGGSGCPDPGRERVESAHP